MIPEDVGSSSDKSIEPLSPLPSEIDSSARDEMGCDIILAVADVLVVTSQAIVHFVLVRHSSVVNTSPIVELAEDVASAFVDVGVVNSDSGAKGVLIAELSDSSKEVLGAEVVPDSAKVSSADKGSAPILSKLFGDTNCDQETADVLVNERFPFLVTFVHDAPSDFENFTRAVQGIIGVSEVMKSKLAELSSFDSVFPSFVSFLPNISSDFSLAELVSSKASYEELSSRFDLRGAGEWW